jgi:hypothetical protein
MTQGKLSKDWVKENSEKIKKAYSIAIENGYDLKSKGIALMLLKIVDSENATEKGAERFSKILELFDRAAKKKLSGKQAN